MTKQYMKYIPTGDVELEINKELEKGSKVLLMIPFLQTRSLLCCKTNNFVTLN